MLDPETFLTELYVAVDDWCQAQPPRPSHPGPPPALGASEVVTLALFGRWARFPSERAFWRWADRHLRGCFPRLPSRPQLNRQIRDRHALIAAVALALAAAQGSQDALYEAIDSTAVPTRTLRRRGRGWLAGWTDKGKSGRIGWYHGFHLLVVTTPDGLVTGFGAGAASTDDRKLAEQLFAARSGVVAGPPSTGHPATGPYLADAGFAGVACQARWAERYGADVIAPPQGGTARRLGRQARRQIAGRRQIVETVVGRLHYEFGLDRERPHTVGGFLARLAARVALHNFCAAINRRLGRPPLATADLVDW